MKSFGWVIGVLLETLLLLAISLAWAVHEVRRPNFPERALDPELEAQDHAYDWRGRDCEVLIDGDSTAGTGFDPRVITAGTGLSACNIASTRPVVDALGMLPLDAYLRQNQRPRVLVLQLAPETFYRSSERWDGPEMLLPMILICRHFPLALAWRQLLEHPLTAFAFEFYVLRAQTGPHGEMRERMAERYYRTVAYSRASGGQQDMEFFSETVCAQSPVPLAGPVDGPWLSGLRRKYEGEGIAVLIRAAPVPDCEPQLRQFQHDLAPYLDQPLQTMPITWFVEGGRHPTLASSRLISADLAQLIRRKQPGLIRKTEATHLP